MTSGLFARRGACVILIGMSSTRMVGIAGAAAWVMVGVPIALQHASSPTRVAAWLAAYLAFGALFALDLRRPRLWTLAAASASVVAIVLTMCDGFEGALLVLIAMRLGMRVERRTALLWIATQTLLLTLGVAIHWSPRPAVMLALPYVGFQLLAYFALELAERAVAANAELRALQELVADSSRIAERLRIAQELHDALGHRLVALTLAHEAALQRTSGEAKRDVERAQSLARELLGDVRAIVAAKHDGAGVNLAQALQAMAGALPRPHVHLDVDPQLRIDDPERGHVVLRCMQEIVTNAARHSGAENLWIAVERSGDGVELRAHDDGRGSDASREGFGLRGMRARLERAGGELRIATEPGRGFDVVAILP
jgi:signal transduction histidine kinase